MSVLSDFIVFTKGADNLQNRVRIMTYSLYFRIL